MNSIIVRGATGAEYTFWAVPLGQPYNAVQGVYMMCHHVGNGHWAVHYVGQAKDLNNRAGSGVWNHEKLGSAMVRGTTHIAAAAFDCDEKTLCWVENDIIQALNPPLNKIAPPGFGFRSAG